MSRTHGITHTNQTADTDFESVVGAIELSETVGNRAEVEEPLLMGKSSMEIAMRFNQ